MKASAAVLVVALLLFAAASASAQTRSTPSVNYVSAESIYLNVGRKAGLAVGSTVQVYRGGKRIATLEVVHVSSESASCRLVDGSQPQRGDRVKFTAAAPKPAPKPVSRTRTPRVKKEERNDEPRRNVLRGYLAAQTLWQEDQTGGGSTSIQPAIGGRLVIDNLGGTSGALRIRHRSRLYYRPDLPADDPDRSRWTHRLTELAVTFGDRDGLAYGAGRLIVRDVAGLGYIDGAFASTRVNSHYRVGVAGGSEPDTRDGSIQSDNGKIGAFVTYETGRHDQKRIESTLGLSGSYQGSEVDREFVYLQNRFSMSSRLNVFQSAEVDVNRGWRLEAQGERFSISNVLLNASYMANRVVTVNASYDSRQNYRSYDTFETPDSLFDNDTYRGYNGGVSLNLPAGVRLRGSGGVRYRGGDDQTNRYMTLAATLRQLFLPGHVLALRYSLSETPFITGHRPTATYRFPAWRYTRVHVGTGAYVYQQNGDETRNYFVELGGFRTISRHYYVNANARQYFGGDLESSQVYAELGYNF